ncbi:hybrid sensor histidine kinase/response regulator transcription factor [Dyadobacter sp. CY312]|uniref:hybrid sensor histidine kinase/response regulator transcription factor n=1 Tax=Dyadobacter sp. CY312 TaxID=2907303 RepID=UPI001F31D53E|nr:hybrid sensor histidine kinase/response regulator transcription factor [Dyadobacter sp. CY312]MCE7038960.1 response regulator [Dyadobacter sp. CY312]
MLYRITVFLLVLLSNFIFAQTSNVKFINIGSNDGLSQNTVRCTFQDKKGLIWLGTMDGLNKYDGYKFTVYKKDAGDPNSLSSNDIKSIAEDADGRLWLATWEGGVNVFDPKSDQFTRYRKGVKSSATGTISSDYIECIFVDSDNNVWIGTASDGLDFYDAKKKQFFHYAVTTGKPGGLTGNNISHIYEDKSKNIWIGTTTGLNLYDKKTRTFRNFTQTIPQTNSAPYNKIKFVFEDSHRNFWAGTYGGGLSQLDRKSGVLSPFKRKELSHDVLLSMAEDNLGNLWIGTENGGLILFNPQKNNVTHFRANENDRTSISSNTINSVQKDRQGNLWLGTLNGGVNVINPEADKFNHYRHRQGTNSLSNNIVNVIYEDTKKVLWIGTDGGGVDRFDRSKNEFRNYKHFKNNRNSIAGDYVLTVAEDKNRDLWIGTWGEGITVLNPEKNSYRYYVNDPKNPKSVNSNYAFYLFKDSQEQLWVGTYGGGLDRYNPSDHSFTHFVNDPKNSASLSGNYILTIQESRSGHLLIGTDGGGICIMDKKTGKFRSFKHAESANSLSNNSVTSIWEDGEGNLWLGTNYGMNRLNPKTGEITQWYTRNGLPSDVITGLISDEAGNLWISTTKGISKYNIGKNTFENFGITDGLQGNEFKAARCLSRNGKMYLGGFNGFNEFQPKDTKISDNEPIIIFTGFQIFNKEVPVAKHDSPLSESINTVRRIVLSYAESVITFEFAALNYINKEKINYAYMLEGFDKQWSRIGSKNNVTYTNLDAGEYLLRVKTVANNGELSANSAEIVLIVTPPYWKTWWFRLLILVAIVGIILLLFYQRLASVEQQNRQLEEVVTARTRELKEANEDLELSNHTKDRFFSILAHDLKNPVAALSGISDLLKMKFSTLSTEEIYSYINDINKSSNSIQNLLITLLDWAQTQTQNIAYIPEDLNLHELLIKNEALLEQQMKSKNIHFSLRVDQLHDVFADVQMIDTVLRNLLSNSIKFTPVNGAITVESKENIDQIILSFIDTGIGMSQEQATSLFDIQRQSVAIGTAGETGTGLGLFIVKEFIDVNKGSISVESTPDQGTTFTVMLPKSKNTAIKSAKSTASISLQRTPETTIAEALSPEKLEALHGKKILIVDDNPEIRTFLRLLLSDVFAVSEAENGAEAIQVAARSQPDVIISDMIMPVMNGLEFCQTIKNNPNTSHIPVILLTSQANENSQLSGYEAGADSYLMKPVKQHMLFQVVYNFIRNQDIIRQKFVQSVDLYPSDLVANQLDKEFLDKIVNYIEENLADPDLDNKKISQLTNLSRTVLYAKFKSLTGQGIHDFIKSIRLKKGLKLLQEGRLNINQIAYEVGFNTPSYFSKSFTKQYGVSPSEYVAKLKNHQSA